MNILIVGGFGMVALDGEPYWTLGARLTAAGHSVRLKECEQTGKAAKVAKSDFLWADAICVYSYGMASQYDLSKDRKTPLKLLIIVAGVPDVWYFQWYGQVWNLPEYVVKARDFQVQAVPVSEYIRNRGASWIDFGNPMSPTQRYLNINCDSLVSRFENLIDKHTHIQNAPPLLDAIYDLFIAES